MRHAAQDFQGAELSDAELQHVQGGGFFSDAWDWIKGAAKTVVNTITRDNGSIASNVRQGVGWILGKGY